MKDRGLPEPMKGFFPAVIEEARGDVTPAPNFQPLRDRVLIKQDRPDERFGKKSLLFKPETTQERPPTGIVLVVGKGRIAAHGEIVPLEVRPGDRVYFKRHAQLPIDLEVEGGLFEQFVTVREDDIVGIVPIQPQN